MPANECSDIICQIQEWQTLIAGLFALVGAALTVLFLRRQISQQQDHFDHANRTLELAARVRLPHALSAFCDYTEQVAAMLIGPEQRWIEPPKEAMDALYHVIQYVEPKAATQIGNILRHHQIQLSRLRDSVKRGENFDEFERDSRLYDIVEMRAYVNSLFEFARGEEEIGPEEGLTKEDMFSALNNAVGFDRPILPAQEFPEVSGMISRNHH